MMSVDDERRDYTLLQSESHRQRHCNTFYKPDQYESCGDRQVNSAGLVTWNALLPSARE